VSTDSNPAAELPAPDASALAQSELLVKHIGLLIQSSGGFIGFDRFMQAALYAPALGYYSAGARKLGAAGDFVTAPETSPLFAQSLANQIAEIIHHSKALVLEIGAGSGRLALDLLLALKGRHGLSPRYQILEVSADLRERQTALLKEAPGLIDQVDWLDRLPEQISGAVIANEVLDALPCRVAEIEAGLWYEIGVALDAEGRLCEAKRPAPADLVEDLGELAPQFGGYPGRYRVELNPQAGALIRTIATHLTAGVALFFDYGFPDHELYHPQRATGTLMAHYRHRAHGDLLRWPGLQDLTSHVDFTAMAHAADDAGATLYGFTSQARFLVNCGIADLVQIDPKGSSASLRALPGMQRLVSEAEMGELFKVLAFGRGIDVPLLGFRQGDRLVSL
jgi:SAM-dependent MidA family methyltransferase